MSKMDEWQGSWWGKWWGLSPSPSVTSRRPKEIVGPPQQSYEELHAKHLEEGTLFEDKEFPPADESIFYSRRPPKPFEWKRPHELCPEPHFMVEGISRFDVRQGELGDCWLLAAVANLTLHKELLERVIPVQSISTSYAGIFRFSFWQYGHWVEVVVDDRLPTYDGKLVFMHSEHKNEFWSALLEKAYAKLHGSYEALKGGSTSEAMEDFTGGLAEMYELAAPPNNLFRILDKAMERKSLLGCSLEADPNVVEMRLPNGLIKGHAYSITAVRLVEVTLPNGRTGRIPLLRLRNPWGTAGSEWQGPWSDQSPEWTCLSSSEREELGLTFSADGEFWISYQDFAANFDKIEICNLDPDGAEAVREASGGPISDAEKVRWRSEAFDGVWSKGASAGGCRNFLASFAANPQFRIALEDADEDDEDGKCTCIVALLQKHHRRPSGLRPPELLTIGFALYKVSFIKIDKRDREEKPKMGRGSEYAAVELAGLEWALTSRETELETELEKLGMEKSCVLCEEMGRVEGCPVCRKDLCEWCFTRLRRPFCPFCRARLAASPVATLVVRSVSSINAADFALSDASEYVYNSNSDYALPSINAP